MIIDHDNFARGCMGVYFLYVFAKCNCICICIFLLYLIVVVVVVFVVVVAVVVVFVWYRATTWGYVKRSTCHLRGKGSSCCPRHRCATPTSRLP